MFSGSEKGDHFKEIAAGSSHYIQITLSIEYNIVKQPIKENEEEGGEEDRVSRAIMSGGNTV